MLNTNQDIKKEKKHLNFIEEVAFFLYIEKGRIIKLIKNNLLYSNFMKYFKFQNFYYENFASLVTDKFLLI